MQEYFCPAYLFQTQTHMGAIQIQIQIRFEFLDAPINTKYLQRSRNKIEPSHLQEQ